MASSLSENTTQRVKVYTTRSCQLCDEIDVDEMVACDSCGLWFHFVCVGVTDAIAYQDWNCERCGGILSHQNENQEVSSPKIASVATEVIENNQIGNPNQSKSISYVSERGSASSKRTSLALQQLQEEREMAIRRDKEYLVEKYKILETIEDDREDTVSLQVSSMERTVTWANLVQQMSHKFDDVSISLSDDEQDLWNQTAKQEYESGISGQRSILAKQLDYQPLQRQQEPKYFEKIEKSKKFGEYRIASPMVPVINPEIGMRSICKSSYNRDGVIPKPNRQQPNRMFGDQTSSKATIPEWVPKYDLKPELKAEGVPNIHKFKSFSFPNQQDQFKQFVNTSQERQRFVNPSSTPKYECEITNPNIQTSKIPNVQPIAAKSTSSQNVRQPSMGFPDFQRSKSGVDPRLMNFSNPVANTSTLETSSLTKSQIAARHVIPKDLPQFYGKSDEWNIFISAYDNGNKLCGFSDGENLGRLQKSLKGDAYDAVKGSLIHAESVPGVIETLRMMFGRSNQIIHTLLDKISKTPSPKPDDLGSLIKFAISVQNLCVTINNSGSLEYLQNPILIQSLTDKMPTQIQLNWAYFKSTLGNADLSALGDWLYKLAQAAMDVVNPSSIKFGEKQKDRKDNNNNSKKSPTFVNAHTASSDVEPKASSKKFSSKCKACDLDSCKKLANCKKFKDLKPEDRWDLIKKNRICGCCFGNHVYFRCESKKICGIDGCPRKHHQLLHNPSFKMVTHKHTDSMPVSNLTEETKHGNSHRLMSSNKKLPDIFRIVPVILLYKQKSIQIFAYLDDGSNLTSLEESVAKQIGAYGTKEKLCVIWSFGDSQLESDSKRLSIKIRGVCDDAEVYSLDHVRTVKKLVLPTQSITREWIAQYSYMKDIPITPYQNASPQMIIGLEYSKLMVSLETIEGQWNQPIVCRTRLGWVVQGPNDHSLDNSFAPYSLNMCECQTSNDDLHKLVQQFFSIENIGVKISEKLLESKSMARARQMLETTRAVHLEIAHSLNTDSCIMAIRNFIGRRGNPTGLYSDNGTNMHGADNALKLEFSKLDRHRIQEEFTTSEMFWTFNPPAAPHFTGSVERMVGIVKKCLDEVMTARYPTDEVLKNLFIETENIVNSRPLTYVSLDSPDDEVLTPNHFLLGSSNGLKPPGNFTDKDLLKNTWKTVQIMADKFWKAFVLDYLPTLVRRPKWHKNVRPIQVDDIVVIADENFKRNTWPKGIVVEVFTDKFGTIRSAKVRTELGTFLTRPVAKLAVLDVRRGENSSENQQIQDASQQIHNRTDSVKLIASVNGGQNVVEKI